MTYKQQLIVPCAGTAQNLAHDLSKAPMMQSTCEHCSNSVAGALRLPRRFGRALIWIYRHTLSPLVGYNCRHLPTCSAYGDEAIERFGLWAGDGLPWRGCCAASPGVHPGSTTYR